MALQNGSGPDVRSPDRFKKGINSDNDALSGYHRAAAAAREARLADQLIEIENRAARRQREARRGAGFISRRVHDLTRFYADTYGDAMTDDDAGRDDMFILAQHVARLNGDPTRNIVRHAQRWCPWMGGEELAALVRRVLAKPYKWGADSLGWRIGLLDATRTRLGIRTIGGIDVPKEAREHRKRERYNAKRRTMTRAEYEAKAQARRAEAAVLNITPDALRKRQQRAVAKAVPSPRPCTYLRSGAHTWDTAAPSLAAPPRLVSGFDGSILPRTPNRSGAPPSELAREGRP